MKTERKISTEEQRKMNKEEFLQSELGSNMKECITTWDKNLEEQYIHDYCTDEYKRGMQGSLWCQAQWEVYQIAIRQFYEVEYHFSRTDEYFGVCTEDESDWLFKIERLPE